MIHLPKRQSQKEEEEYIKRKTIKLQKQLRQGKYSKQTIQSRYEYCGLKSINQYRLVAQNIRITCKFIKDMDFVSEQMQPYFKQEIARFKNTVNLFQEQMNAKLNYFHDLDITLTLLNDKQISMCFEKIEQLNKFIKFIASDIKNGKKEIIKDFLDIQKPYGVDEIDHMITNKQGQFHLYTCYLSEKAAKKDKKQVVMRSKEQLQTWNQTMNIYRKFEESLKLFEDYHFYFTSTITKLFRDNPEIASMLSKKLDKTFEIFVKFLQWKKQINRIVL